MKNILLIIITITIICLGYVHQQVEIVKLSYDTDLKQDKLIQTLDRNLILRYNISRFRSPDLLRLALLSREENIKICGRGEYITIALNKPRSAESPSPSLASRPNPFIRLFTASTAEAEDLKQ